MATGYESIAPVRAVSPRNDGGHYFFGYYDLPAYSADGRRHLANRVTQMDHMPREGEANTIGVIDLETGGFTPLARTLAWNFQQGSMLQWLPPWGGQAVYNDFRDGEYCAVIRQADGGERCLPLPVSAVSPDGRHGLSVGFGRIHTFRPGYGYHNAPDPFRDTPIPAQDGIFLMDMQSGAHKLLASYQTLARLFPLPSSAAGSKLVVNHITFNPASNRFVFLLRYFREGGATWGTAIGSADLEGNIYPWRQYGIASHYYWKDEETLLIFADAGEGLALYELRDQSQAYRVIAGEFVPNDIHCSYSPDLRFVIGDGYPDPEGYRSIYLYDLAAERGTVLGRFYSPAPPVMDIRCDLHVRWAPGGKRISFDSIHEGFRGIYEMDLSGVLPE